MSRSKEEAVAAGVVTCETQHNMKRRKPWHDCSRKGTYMLTLVVEGRRPLLGRLVVPAGIPCADMQGVVVADTLVECASPAAAKTTAVTTTPTASVVGVHIVLTTLGRAIRDEEVKIISAIYKTVEVWKFCLMPNHIHMIVRITEASKHSKRYTPT